MTRDDFVKQIENAEALLELIQAKTNLHIWDMAYAAGAKDEREACAKVCEDIEEAYQRQERMRHPILRTDAETGSGECADAIRARGKK